MRRMNRRTFTLYLQVKNETKAMQIRVMEFPNGLRFFSIKVPRDPIRLELKYFGFIAILSIVTSKYRLKNTLSGDKIAVTNEIGMTPYRAFLL